MQELVAANVSGSEYNLIKNKLSSFDPDLIIMYDGWNDHSTTPAKKTIQNWESVCKLGKIEGFDTIITVQPLTHNWSTCSNGTGTIKWLLYILHTHKHLNNMLTRLRS